MSVKFEIKDRVKFLMEYDEKKTLSEQIPDSRFSPMKNSSQQDSEKKIEYPSYCKYPEKATVPGKNKVGVSGVEAIPNGFCYYPCPKQFSEQGGVSGIFLPVDVDKISFWNEINFESFLKDHMKKNKYPKNYLDGLTNHFLKIFPFGTVRGFDISGVTYNTWITQTESSMWTFKWFYSKNTKNPYPKIEWTDPRNTWDKIVDDFGDVAQWTAAAIFFISGFFTEGSTWLLLAELVTEGSLGVITAQRKLEKGDNLGASFDLLFGLTPFLKTGKLFTGIDMEVARKLTSSMKRANLSSNSTPQEILTWYRSLSEPEKITWSKMVKAGDEFSESKLKKVLGESFNEFKDYLKSNPNSIKNIKLYQNVNLREFGISSIIGLIGILVEAFYGEKLNDEEKGKLTKIYNNANKISKELGEEVKINFIYNADKIIEILDTIPTNKMLKELDFMPEGKPHADWFNTEFKDSIQSGGGTHIENPSDSSKTISNLEISQEEILKYESEGYKRGDSMTEEEWSRATTPKKLNGVWFYKIR